MILPRICDVRFHPAEGEHLASGILGWITADIDSVRVDAITLRRTREGRLVLSFPERRGKDGARHPTVRPLGPKELAAIEHEIIDSIKRQGHKL